MLGRNAGQPNSVHLAFALEVVTLQQTNIIAMKTHPFSRRKYICKTWNFCCLTRFLEDFVNRQIANPVPLLRCRSADERLQRWEY